MTAKGRSWKLERASVHRAGAARAKSNKYTKNDGDTRPAAHSRSKVWVGAYFAVTGKKSRATFARFLL